ncbi:MAG: ATP-dependent RecD-like DNA helicase [Lachnospiraceae bacterium]|nr:ATP-dependent RecD-like DNA helicase [Lachnospiraceae bacterium]
MTYDNETIKGYVEDIVFRNEDNGYTVLKLSGNEEKSSVVGFFHYINLGEYIEATGHYSEHPIYGSQFNVEQYEVKMPADVEGYERYLGSGIIKGIGPALAARIIDMFGEDTFRIMEEEPECLAKVKGISSKKALEIGVLFAEKKDMRDAMVFLQKYGITINLAVKIYQRYNNQLYDIIRDNPYRLAEEIDGVGFKTADDIAAKVGIAKDSDYRIRGGILYVLSDALAEGHTYLPEENLIRAASRLLDVEESAISGNITELTIDRKIMRKEYEGVTCCYDIRYYYMELGVAARLFELADIYGVKEDVLERRIERISGNEGIVLDDKQKEAVLESFRNGLTIITGGPGTGKTTTINTIIRCFEEENFDIVLAAPTGRAAKRMTEACGYAAKTIHRLLEAGGLGEGMGGFGKNEDNPIEADLVIIDEMSMVDISLMNALLKAIVPGTRLILVGDVNQLPSVGPGNVLKDIIDAGCFGVVKLEHIFRQASRSNIVVNAHMINAGKVPDLEKKEKDFFLLKRYDPQRIIEVMLYLISKKLPEVLECKPTDIQILTPMRKGNLGVERLNKVLQNYMNPAEPMKREKDFGDRIFREGDKVMQTKNNYQLEWEICGKYNIPLDAGLGVFNGDMGIITAVNTFSEIITVEFDDGRCVDYSYKDAEELEHAYAVTIHKSQGSEYPGIIVPVLSGPEMLMTRNLLYTAVTRAKKCVALVGDERMFTNMIYNDMEKVRYTGLNHCIIDVFRERGGKTD